MSKAAKNPESEPPESGPPAAEISVSGTSGEGKPRRRSTRVMLASSILALEAFVAFFATLVIWGLRSKEINGALILGLGMGLSLALILTCAVVRKPWGIHLGWVLQVALISLGFVEPSMFFIGVIFAACWAYALYLGAKIDRENAQRDAEQLRWEREHPEDT